MAIDTQFAELVLPDTGYYAIGVFTRNHNNEEINYFRFTSDFEALLRNSFAADKKLYDTIYYCTASLTRDDDGNKHRNLAAKQCLHIDIDVGHSGFVQTQPEAIREVYRLCEIINIPPPSAIVSSGYGVHVYWSFTHAFTDKDILVWQRLANGLRNAALEHAPGLTKDLSKWTTRTALLRMPGTKNKKRAKAEHVEVIGGTFEKYPIFYFDGLLQFEDDLTPRAGNGERRSINQVDGELLKTQCAVIAHLAGLNGDIPYPAWRDLIHYSHHVDQGVEWAHDISKGPQYNAAKIDYLYDYYVQRHEQSEYFPSRCSTLCANAGLKQEDICRRCPLYMAGKTPLHLASAKPLEPAGFTDVTAFQQFAMASDTLPVFINEELGACEYVINQYGQLARRPTTITDEDRGGPLFSNAWWVEGKFDENNITYYTVVVVDEISEGRDEGKHAFVPKVTRVTKVRGETFSDAKAMTKGLGNAGVRVIGDRKHAYDYAMLTCNYSGNLSDAVPSFGWQPDGRFVLGRGAIRSDGLIVPVVLGGMLKLNDAETKVATNAISQSASELGVIAAMSAFAEHASSLGKALLLAAISAPLYELIGLEGYTILLYGPSGQGKTSLNRLLSCIYGRPDAGMIRGTDTIASWDGTRGMYRSMPIMFDEFTIAGKGSRTTHDEEDKDTYILTTSNGRSKKIGSPDQRQRGGTETWHTLTIGGSNIDYINSVHIRVNDMRAEAYLARVSQIKLDCNVIDKTHWAEVETLFEANHGLIGAKFMAYVVPRREELTQRLIEAREVGMKNVPTEARFKVRVAACALVAQDIMKAAGLADFGLKVDEVMKLLELHRFDPTRSAVSAWNLPSNSARNHNSVVLAAILTSMQQRFSMFREDATGACLPMATQGPIHGGVAGKVTVLGSGDVEYLISENEIMRDKALKDYASLIPEATRGLTKLSVALTEHGMIVPCIRILLRNGVPLLPQIPSGKP